MNVQPHMSGQRQIAGQVPNQAGTQLPGVPQQNESSFPYQIQNLGAHHNNAMCMEPQFVKARRFMQEKIYELLTQRQQQTHDRQPKQFLGFVRRLDDVLFRNAASKDEYMSLETLETRLHVLIKRSPRSNHNQHHPQLINSSSPIATMIPTPRMAHSGNSNMINMSAVDPSMVASSGGNGIAPATSGTGNLLPTTIGMPSASFNSSDGSISNGYEQSLSEFSMSSSGNMVSSSGVQRMTSQMIPTPGFNSSNNQSFRNLESSNGTAGFSTGESTKVSQTLTQKQHVGGQNSRILHNLGSHIGGGIRSGLQQKAYGFSNGGLGIMQRNLQLINSPGNSEGYLVTSSNDNSPKPLQQHYDQHQQPMMHGIQHQLKNKMLQF